MSEDPLTTHWSLTAAKKLKEDPTKWHAWIYAAADQGGIFVTGAICPPISRGKNKGQPNYRRYTRGTKRVVHLTRSEMKIPGDVDPDRIARAKNWANPEKTTPAAEA